MPICLPPDKAFKDTNRVATAVGLGIIRENTNKGKCFTDGNGPVVFQRCSWSYVPERKNPEDPEITDLYPESPCRHSKTPSDNDPLCSNFYDEIWKLK